MKQDYRKIPNLNLLPAEYRRRHFPLVEIAFIVLIGLGLLLGAFLYQNYRDTTKEVTSLELRLEKAKEQLEVARTRDAHFRELKAALEKEKAKRERMDLAFDDLMAQQRRMKTVIHLLVNLPSVVEIKGITQKSSEIEIQGEVPNYGALLQYFKALSHSSVDAETTSLDSKGEASSVLFTLVLKSLKEAEGS